MKHALLTIAMLSTAAYATYRWTTADDAPERKDVHATDGSLVQDRIWIDHIPRNDRDTIQVFAALTEQPVGVFQAVSQWRGQHELFLYEGHGGELRMHFPHNGDRERVAAKARPCDAPKMDYCLELSGNSRGTKRYFSRKGWEIDGARDARAIEHRAAAIVEQLTKP